MSIYNKTTTGGSFTETTIEEVWRKATPEIGRPGYARDTCGALIRRASYGLMSLYGWEVDHIIPKSVGGSDHLSNLQPLQWKNNRHKSNDLIWQCKVRN